MILDDIHMPGGISGFDSDLPTCVSSDVGFLMLFNALNGLIVPPVTCVPGSSLWSPSHAQCSMATASSPWAGRTRQPGDGSSSLEALCKEPRLTKVSGGPCSPRGTERMDGHEAETSP